MKRICKLFIGSVFVASTSPSFSNPTRRLLNCSELIKATQPAKKIKLDLNPTDNLYVDSTHSEQAIVVSYAKQTISWFDLNTGKLSKSVSFGDLNLAPVASTFESNSGRVYLLNKNGILLSVKFGNQMTAVEKTELKFSEDVLQKIKPLDQISLVANEASSKLFIGGSSNTEIAILALDSATGNLTYYQQLKSAKARNPVNLQIEPLESGDEVLLRGWLPSSQHKGSSLPAVVFNVKSGAIKKIHYPEIWAEEISSVEPNKFVLKSDGTTASVMLDQYALVFDTSSGEIIKEYSWPLLQKGQISSDGSALYITRPYNKLIDFSSNENSSILYARDISVAFGKYLKSFKAEVFGPGNVTFSFDKSHMIYRGKDFAEIFSLNDSDSSK